MGDCWMEGYFLVMSATESILMNTLSSTFSYEVSATINPLVTAAAPLLTLATQLQEQRHAPDLKTLHTTLCQEIKTFETKTRASGYSSTISLAARYFLCALLDEMIIHTLWGDHHWNAYTLLNTFQHESSSDERFFAILERSSEDAITNIDLLELAYLCLSMGYQGKYRKTSDNAALTTLMDKLYQLIREVRGEFSKCLFITPIVKPIFKPKRWYTRWRLPPLWAVLLVTIVVLFSIYLPYHHRLDHLTAKISASFSEDAS